MVNFHDSTVMEGDARAYIYSSHAVRISKHIESSFESGTL
jgi:hypothetical protein